MQKIVASKKSINFAVADYVCDGIDDDIEINAAILDVQKAGGGKVIIDGGFYSISSSIVIRGDNVSLEGYGAHLKVTNSFNNAGGAIFISGSNNSSVLGLIIDTMNFDLINNKNPVPQGLNGIVNSNSNNILIENCSVFLSKAHAYGIWTRFGNNIQLINNYINGGSFLEMQPWQEGIEFINSRNSIVNKNIIENI
jgi:hypothetical protein